MLNHDISLLAWYIIMIYHDDMLHHYISMKRCHDSRIISKAVIWISHRSSTVF